MPSASTTTSLHQLCGALKLLQSLAWRLRNRIFFATAHPKFWLPECFLQDEYSDMSAFVTDIASLSMRRGHNRQLKLFYHKQTEYLQSDAGQRFLQLLAAEYSISFEPKLFRSNTVLKRYKDKC